MSRRKFDEALQEVEVRCSPTESDMPLHGNLKRPPFAHMRRKSDVSRRTTFILFSFILCIPLGSLYLGYAIGNHFMGPRKKFSDLDVVVDTYMLNWTHQNKHYLTVDPVGGLGNMMFQYASLYGVARGNAMLPVISDDSQILNVFPDLKANALSKADINPRWLKFRETRASGFDRRSFSLNFEKNLHMEGFFQSWKYFEHKKKDIRKQFKFSAHEEALADSLLAEAYHNAQWQEPVQPSEVTFIGIHIRRGDFLHDYNTLKGYTVATEDYFDRAMNYFRKRFENVLFIVCSDDKEWGRYNIKSLTNPVFFSPYEAAVTDMSILSHCNHTIMSVGSFSWWGAYLAGGEVVYYRDFPVYGSTLASTFDRDDYYYSHWIPM